MISLRTLSTRAPRVSRLSICAQCLRRLPVTTRSIHLPSATHPSRSTAALFTPTTRNYASKTSADDVIETITEQYATARDEFEIATEETGKKSIYAQADREAARSELDVLKAMLDEAVKGEDGEEVKRRVGGRIRELDAAVLGLERAAQEDH